MEIYMHKTIHMYMNMLRALVLEKLRAVNVPFID